MNPRLNLRPFLVLLLAAAAAAGAASPPPARTQRAELVAGWQAQGLQPVASRQLDLLYLRPGGLGRGGGAAVQVAPVDVELSPNWLRADRDLERARLRPAEMQQVKDEVAQIVADELRRELGALRGGSGEGGPVLEARVLDLYLNAPDLQTATMTRTYTRSFGHMVLVAELRERPGGTLLLGSWDHRPAREFATLRLTTRVENAIEVRAAAHAWARKLRRELDRLGAGG